MKDRTNRMVMGQLDSELSKKIAVEEAKAEREEKVMGETAEKISTNYMPANVAELPVLDLDLESFFFTGNIQYTFKLGDKFSFTLRLPASEKIAELHRSLYATIKSEEETITDQEFAIKQTNGIIALSLIKYGPVDLTEKSYEERLDFVNKLPNVTVQTLSRCYLRLEMSASKLLTDSADSIKN